MSLIKTLNNINSEYCFHWRSVHLGFCVSERESECIKDGQFISNGFYHSSSYSILFLSTVCLGGMLYALKLIFRQYLCGTCSLSISKVRANFFDFERKIQAKKSAKTNTIFVCNMKLYLFIFHFVTSLGFQFYLSVQLFSAKLKSI